MHQKRRSGSNNNNNNRNHRGGRNNKYRSGGGGGGYDSQSLARQKKHAQTQKEKYQNMARDAQVNGERVDAEYYFQHVEHYVRVLAEIEAKEPKPERRDDAHSSSHDDMEGGDEQEDNSAHGDDDNGDDSEVSAAPEAQSESRPKAPRGRRRAAPRHQDSAKEIPLPSSVIPEAEPLAASKAAASST